MFKGNQYISEIKKCEKGFFFFSHGTRRRNSGQSDERGRLGGTHYAIDFQIAKKGGQRGVESTDGRGGGGVRTMYTQHTLIALLFSPLSTPSNSPFQKWGRAGTEPESRADRHGFLRPNTGPRPAFFKACRVDMARMAWHKSGPSPTLESSSPSLLLFPRWAGKGKDP